MNELIPINITIADRTYRLKIDTKDEETVRKTVKVINYKILEYKSNLAGKDMQDFVSIAQRQEYQAIHAASATTTTTTAFSRGYASNGLLAPPVSSCLLG